MRALLLSLVTVVAVAACGPKATFRLSSDENNEYALREALARRQLPAAPTPVNASGQPRVFVLTAGSPPQGGPSGQGGSGPQDAGRNRSIAVGPKTIVAYDLAAGSVLWKTDADVGSRIAVGGDFLVALEGKQIVARDQNRGAPRWKIDVEGTFIGVAADAERVYVTHKDGSTWFLRAYSGSSGAELWNADASGQLGAPAAHGGVVYVPFLAQWLTIVDGRTGKQLTRVRGIDEQISMLRVTSQVAYYGSKQGVFRLDERSASGKRTEATYGQVKIPAQLERTTYGRDAYDPIHQTYTAADRSRVLWSSEATASGPMKLTADGYAIHYFRYVLGFGNDGELRWAYSHPRVELIASEHTGFVIAGVGANGDIVALDPRTGAVRAKKSLGTTAPVLGATFDADGWHPSDATEAVDTAAALVSIARDRDARFDRVKELAVGALAKLPGSGVTSELLAILEDTRAPQRLKDTVVDLLVARRDPASLAVLTQQLAVKTDYLAGTQPDALAPVAKAIAGLAGTDLDRKQVALTLVALQEHLDAPTTSSPELVYVIAAMVAIGGGAERPALASHLLLYHADDDRGADATWQKAIVEGLAHKASPRDRVVLRYVAQDARSTPGLVALIQDAIGPH